MISAVNIDMHRLCNNNKKVKQTDCIQTYKTLDHKDKENVALAICYRKELTLMVTRTIKEREHTSEQDFRNGRFPEWSKQ